ncbi:MAG: PAS domain S-box protein [Methylophaga sp.]|nr:PAS domain S-box protein [Methylophaga sp.]
MKLMLWKVDPLTQWRITAPLSYGLLIVILATDSLTPLGFAHGILYSPVLLLAAFIGHKRLLDTVFALSILAIWFGLFWTLNGNHDLLAVNSYANRILSSLLLLAIYILSRISLNQQKNYLLQQEQLQISANLARLGIWYIDDNEQLILSLEAAQILNITPQPMPLQHFARMLVEADGKHFLANIGAEKLPLDAEYRWRQSNGEIKWIRLVAHQHNQHSNLIHGVLQDIHANRIVEAQVAEEERRFRYMADSMQMFAWTALPDGNLDYVSRYTIEFLGASEKFITENWLSYIHPDDQQPTLNRWAQSLKTGEPYLVEFRIRRYDGKYFWYLTRATAARDEQGKIFKWYGSGIDNTESKLLQQHSERLSQQLQNTLASITDAFFSLDKNLCFSYANEQAANLLERPRSTLLNQLKISDTAIDADGSFSRQLKPAILSKKMTAFNFWFASRELWLDVRVYPADEGLTVYLRDITRLRREHAELILLRSAIAQLNDIVIITEAEPIDEPGPRIVFVNDAFERLTGYSREEAIGHSPRFLQGPKTQRSELQRIRQALLSKQPVRAEITNYCKDNRETEIELNIVPISTDGHQFSHFVSIQRDVSGEKALQKQLQLAQRMEAIGQLTGGIAHDFNNLLTVITGNNDILQDALQDQPKLLSLSNLIGHAAERGAGLTRNLLAFARRQPLSPNNVDMNQLIEQLQELLRSSLGQKCQLHLALADGLWPVMIDTVQLESSLLNLAINARDAMASGGQLTISTENITGQTFDDDTELSGSDWVKVSICDSGSGIADDMLDKIFEPFFTTKSSGKGSGLGLSMVFGFIKQSGGHIRVHSAIDKGTCFNLFIPRAKAVTTSTENTVKPLPAIETTGKTRQKTILVVEDNDLVRHFAVSQLRDAGYQVLEAAQSAEALDWINSDQPIDLLFTDVLMPDSLSGSELAMMTRQIRPALPVLFTSGYTEDSLDDLSEEEKQHWLLHKPYHRATLLQRVAHALNMNQE